MQHSIKPRSKAVKLQTVPGDHEGSANFVFVGFLFCKGLLWQRLDLPAPWTILVSPKALNSAGVGNVVFCSRKS